MKEIELLFKITPSKAQELRKKLKDFFIRKDREIDTYFYPPHKDFLVSSRGRENLRVRKSKSKNELTYKKVIYTRGKYSHSLEKNIELLDTKGIIEILKNLGFRKHLIVDKQREIFEDQDFHITIDKIKNLGLFVEVEWKGRKGPEKNIRTICREKARKLGLKKVQDKGYLRLLEEKISV